MQNTGESQMTILNTCVKCSKIINSIIEQQSTGLKVQGNASTKLLCHGPPAVRAMHGSQLYLMRCISPHQENMHPGTKIEQLIDLELDSSTTSCMGNLCDKCHIPLHSGMLLPQWKRKDAICISKPISKHV